MTAPDPSERLRQALQAQPAAPKTPSTVTAKPLVQVGPAEREVFVQIATEGLPGDLVAIEILGPDALPMVQVLADGTIKYGSGYDPDEAAKIFWGALAAHFGRNIAVAPRNLTEA